MLNRRASRSVLYAMLPIMLNDSSIIYKQAGGDVLPPDEHLNETRNARTYQFLIIAHFSRSILWVTM